MECILGVKCDLCKLPARTVLAGLNEIEGEILNKLHIVWTRLFDKRLISEARVSFGKIRQDIFCGNPVLLEKS